MRGRPLSFTGLASIVVAAALAATAAAAPDRAGAPTAKRAPDFALRTIDFKTFRLSAQRGKVAVLDFLVPGCGECEIEAPSLEKVARRFGARGLKVLILDVAQIDDRQLRGYYYGQLGMAHVLVATDKGFHVARKYGASTLGTTIVVGRDGTIRWRGSWVGNEGRLLGEIRTALG
jgi:cytochrome c biogenesis protein CcmG/thiol:disulfide interchange protein DsbE